MSNNVLLNFGEVVERGADLDPSQADVTDLRRPRRWTESLAEIQGPAVELRADATVATRAATFQTFRRTTMIWSLVPRSGGNSAGAMPRPITPADRPSCVQGSPRDEYRRPPDEVSV
jgi:hypothetical protein